MNTRLIANLAGRLAGWPHFLLAGHLLMLHALAFGGWQVPAVRLLWVVAIGLFLIWQPFVTGERQIELRQAVVLLAAVLSSTLLLGPWLLLIWCGTLAAAIGGRGLGTERRKERWGYLLAFGYLVGITVLGVVPEISSAVAFDPQLRAWLAHFMPLLLPVLLLFPVRRPQRKSGQNFDLFYGMMVFLVLAVVVLGSLAYMLVGAAGYLEALVKTSLAVAGTLLLVAWAWNPRAGFSGLGATISRSMMSLGMPLDLWLIQLSEESDRHADPDAFLDAAMQRLQAIPWAVGLAWRAGRKGGQVGDRSAFLHGYQANDLQLTVYFPRLPSPAMRWHVDWLLRLVVEFYLVKLKTHQLQDLRYVQAIYETGARVTHDVKNLLQSMQVLCYTLNQPGDPGQVTALLGRQLPQMVDRLKATLEKLESPRPEPLALLPATSWWAAFRARNAHLPVDWQGEAAAGENLPGALFDSVAENLLQNALAKRQRQPGLRITVQFDAGGLVVSDDGRRIASALADALFGAPVDSEDGLGIGLYHAAQQAETAGYVLTLSENQPGRVAFSLAVRR